jgi:hypothetical protein
MTLGATISRVSEFYGRHGLLSTLRRGTIGIRRTFFSNRMAIFSCELGHLAAPGIKLPSSVSVERVLSLSTLDLGDLQQITSFWNPTLAKQSIRERFEKHSSLWLMKVKGILAGYGWTLRGTSIEPYFFSLCQTDVHLFDFHVFPEFRGNGFNPLLVTFILGSVAVEGNGRAFIEAAEWNTAQLSSLRKTPFRQIAWGRKSVISRRPIVSWIASAVNE